MALLLLVLAENVGPVQLFLLSDAKNVDSTHSSFIFSTHTHPASSTVWVSISVSFISGSFLPLFFPHLLYIVQPISRRLTYSSGSQSSPWRQSWRWHWLAVRGHAQQRGGTHCPSSCQFSEPRTQRSCREKGDTWTHHKDMYTRIYTIHKKMAN